MNGNWKITREKILMFAGLTIIGAEMGISTVGGPFQFEFLLTGLALCGVSIAQWGDKK